MTRQQMDALRKGDRVFSLRSFYNQPFAPPNRVPTTWVVVRKAVNGKLDLTNGYQLSFYIRMGVNSDDYTINEKEAIAAVNKTR